ncbi:uncharacterized protein LOC106166087 [Lingula anatina]|uniref:Uncharacterized protein LOC106166087 n=1 Tax=Lingula anatina TaxID=7574 RepID=A0A1S3IPX0_LINAN|nr:uncharacterized protein LOC106166087 [Lingula anatina]|eukprot:XP_013399961.1 uncharacterized protein LOC106166087 [Lingula anatina]
MKAIGETLQTVKVKGVATLGLCLLIAFLLRPQDSYKLQPSWVKERSESETQEDFDAYNIDIQLPPPVITDLESDGVNEVVLILHNSGGQFNLEILATPETPVASVQQTLPHVEVRKEVVMPIGKRKHQKFDQISVPVAMATGYLEEYQSMVQVRKQVIVIVTSDWRVLCYDHELNLSWQKQLINTHGTRGRYHLKAMGALVLPLQLKKNDKGVIIVGGSYEHATHDAEELRFVASYGDH